MYIKTRTREQENKMFNRLISEIYFYVNFSYQKLKLNIFNLLNKLFVTNHPTLKNTYEVKYSVCGKDFILLTKKVKGPCKIVAVIDKDGNNVKDKVIPYFGPDYKLHNTNITPEMLGYEELQILTPYTTKRFTKSEILYFPEPEAENYSEPKPEDEPDFTREPEPKDGPLNRL